MTICSNVTDVEIPSMLGEEKQQVPQQNVQWRILPMEIIAENFPNLEKETDIQIQEAQTVPKNINTKRLTPSPIITKI